MTKTEYELVKAIKDLMELAREDDNEWETRRGEFDRRLREHKRLVDRIVATNPVVGEIPPKAGE